ncbi:MAG: hypothetical protein OJF49_003397 [Ktedonobacterales bacterium]|jgi:tRNA A-37 threonylcarbamoyl transferase component Bud32|nr:MAG: hypothetical protein OJF49_003397 [Ktedonobacterales bacterium]
MLNLDGQVLDGKYRLIRKIGAGGMGEVYLGEQINLGRQVAVKVVSVDDAAFHSKDTSEVRQQFEREAKTLANLTHPNILPVHDYGVQSDLLYLIMDYAPGGSLADAIKGNGKHPLKLPAPVPFAVDLISQVASALQYVHERGIIHRDVKPGNVLIRVEDGQWHVLLADFGVARGVDTSGRTQVTGTFLYMAPEQFNGKFSAASDQYALAVMAFQLLAGRTPFDGELAALTRAHLYEQPPSLHALNPAVSPAVEAVINRGLAKDPAQRYPTVAAFGLALREAAAGRLAAPSSNPIADATTMAATPPPLPPMQTQQGPAPQWNPSPAPQPKPKGGSGRVLVTALAAVLLLVAIIGGIGLANRFNGNGGGTGKATATATTAQPTVTATATGPAITPTLPPTAAIPFCAAGTTLQITDDATCVPLPASVSLSNPLISDVAPTCDTNGSIQWKTADNTTLTCGASASSLTITPTQANTLGCVYAPQPNLAAGYASVLVAPGTNGTAVLGIRQGTVSLGGGTNQLTGYYLAVSPSTLTFYKVIDAGGTPQIVPLTPAGIPSLDLAAHYVIGVLYNGNSFQLYINGNPVGDPAKDVDKSFSKGWMNLCSQGGPVTFQDALLYSQVSIGG